MVKTIFTPPKCEIVIINNRKQGSWKFFEIIRVDGKQFGIVGKSSSYNKNKNLLTIKLFNDQLPIIVEVEKEFLINNTKNNDK